MVTATPAKLKDGSWGVRVSAKDAKRGHPVKVTTKSGKSWYVEIAWVIWENGDIALCSTK